MADKQLKDKAVKIKGKDYVLVADRVTFFNEEYQNGFIETELLSEPTSNTIVIKAIVTPDLDKPNRKFVGHAQEVVGDGMINKTSAMENAETSAVGRALAMMGIGVVESIASVDEIKKAENRSKRTINFATEKQIKWIRDTAARVFGLDNQEDIDKAIELTLTVPVDKVPSFKVKDAVDKIIASKPEPKPLNTDGIDLTPEDEQKIKDGTFLDDIPY